jgi:hypothetical protein
LHDGIELDRRGVPAAVICTEEFVPSARAQAAICGNPTYPFVVVPHPIGSLTREELRRRAAVAAPQIVAILTGSP